MAWKLTHKTHRSKQGIANDIIQACEHVTLTSTHKKEGSSHGIKHKTCRKGN